MATFNLRGLPDEIARQAKATAASEGKTIVEFMVDVLERDRSRGGWVAVVQKDESESSLGVKSKRKRSR